jgi:protocatechuate 3,4-dioxygenase beta subunit
MSPQPERDNTVYVHAVHDKGLAFDLGTMSRRRMLGVLGGAGALAVAGGAALLGGANGASAAACAAEVESETAGPFPADGSNGPDVRTLSGVVRSDIRSSFGTSSTVAQGVPLQFSLIVNDLSCNPLAGAAVYVWHCDREGRYSLYSSGVTNENYLRGIQVTDATGKVTFNSIFPACYSGRWPHIHFEVYSSPANATSGSGPIRKTSQIALPEAVSDTVYANAAGYSASVTNMSRITLASDMVFGDDLAAREMATVTGSVSAGYVATLPVTVNPSATESGGGGGGPTRPTRPSA